MSKAKLDGLGYGMEFAGPLGGVQRIQAQNRAAGSTLTLAPMDMNLALLMTLAQPAVKGVLTNTPPGSPATGDAYVVGTSPTGAWVGFNNQVTIWDGTAWQFSGTPKTGWRVVDSSVSSLFVYSYTGSAWTRDVTGDGSVGIGATYGLTMRAIAGSVYDLNFVNPGSTDSYMRVPTGANNPVFPNGINFGQQDLKNYSEGTWTPTMGGSTAFGTQTYSTQAGRYTRIGRMVFVTCRVTLASTSGATGSIIISGLPFASSSSLTSRSGAIAVQFFNFTGYTTFLKMSGTHIPGGVTYILPADENFSAIDTTALLNNSFIDISAFYEV